MLPRRPAHSKQPSVKKLHASMSITILDVVPALAYTRGVLVRVQVEREAMDRRTFVKTVPAIALMAGASSTLAEELQPISLPKPEKEGGKSVLAALWERRTTREIKEDKPPPQVLSNLLWAAFGVNRGAGPTGLPGRTAASASNSQEIDLYVALAEGIYLYEEQRTGWLRSSRETTVQRQRKPVAGLLRWRKPR